MAGGLAGGDEELVGMHGEAGKKIKTSNQNMILLRAHSFIIPQEERDTLLVKGGEKTPSVNTHSSSKEG